MLPMEDLLSCERPTRAKVTNAMLNARTNHRNCGSRGLFQLTVLFLKWSLNEGDPTAQARPGSLAADWNTPEQQQTQLSP